MSEFTHKEAVQRIGKWLRNTRQCGVVMLELSTAVSETPDAIGFYGGGNSILVECKVSRADFLADSGKLFRRQMDFGMGDFRYYAAPVGLISENELPDYWGLLEIYNRCVQEKIKAKMQDASKRNEVKMLMSAIRRLELSTAVFVKHEENPTQNADKL